MNSIFETDLYKKQINPVKTCNGFRFYITVAFKFTIYLFKNVKYSPYLCMYHTNNIYST